MELRETVMVNGAVATITMPLSRYKDKHWGIPCRRSGTNFELKIEVHRRQRGNFDHAFGQWIRSTFQCMLGTEQEADEMLEQVARNHPNTIASLSEEASLDRARKSRSPSSLIRRGIQAVRSAVSNDVDKDKVRWGKMMQSLNVWHHASNIRGAVKLAFERTVETTLAREVDEWIPTSVEASKEGNMVYDEETIMEAVRTTESIRRSDRSVDEKMKSLKGEFEKAKSAYDRLVLDHGNKPPIAPLRHIQYVQKEMLQRAASEVKILSIALDTMETCNNGSNVSYLCSKDRITDYLRALKQELDTMPDAQSEIDSLQQQIGWSIRNGVCDFACLSEDEKAEFVKATRAVRRFQPKWLIPGVIASSLTFRFSKVASCLLLGASVAFAFRPTPDVTGNIESTPEEAVCRYRELLGVQERKRRLEKMQEKIQDFLQKNAKCATLMLEHCPAKDTYNLSSHGDVFEFDVK